MEDTIQGNVSSIVPNGHTKVELNRNGHSEVVRTYSTDTEPLRTIREEKSRESLEKIQRSEVIDISVEEVLVEVSRRKSESDKQLIVNIEPSFDNSNHVNVTNEERVRNSSNADDKDPSDPNRLRSISLTDQHDLQRIAKEDLRSSSFSGGAMHNQIAARRPSHPRAESDPGLGIVPTTLAGSVSSQESDRQDSASMSKHIKFKQAESRKKSRSENEDDRDRSSSVLSDVSNPSMRLRVDKRLRGSTVSLGISPKSSRALSFTESSPSSSYYRDCYQFAELNRLRKQRHRRDVDSALRHGSTIHLSDKRKFSSRYEHGKLYLFCDV